MKAACPEHAQGEAREDTSEAMSKHIMQNLVIYHYGPWVRICRFVYPLRLRQWLYGFAPVRGRCYLRHVEDGRTKCNTRAETIAAGKMLVFGCGCCRAAYVWEKGKVYWTKDRDTLRGDSTNE